MQFSKKDTNVVKGVAIIAMLFHHCYVTGVSFKAHGVSFAPFSKGTVVSLALWSKVCVGIFVFLSAYGITLALKRLYDNGQFDRSNLSGMSARRIWKILAGFWPVFILAVLGCALWAPDSFEVYGQGLTRIIHVVLDFLGLADLFGTPTLIGTWWYLSLAFVEIMLLPLLYYIYRRCGAFLTLSLSVFLPMALSLEMSNLVRYLPVMVLGIWFAQENLFPRIARWRIPHTGTAATRTVEFALLAVLILGTVWLKNSDFGQAHENITDSVTPLAVIVFTWLFLTGIPYLREILAVLGRYSMNIFLLHNFIRARWFEDFSYSFRFWWLIVLVLLLDNFVLSVAIEWLKKVLRYNSFVSKIENVIQAVTIEGDNKGKV